MVFRLRSAGEGQADLVVIWNSGDRAKAFLTAKGIEADCSVVALTEDTLGSMAKALGCDPDAIGVVALPEK